MIKTPIYMFDDLSSTELDSVPVNGILFIKEPRLLLISLVNKKNITALTTVADLLADNKAFMVISELEHIYDAAAKTLTIKQMGVPS